MLPPSLMCFKTMSVLVTLMEAVGRVTHDSQHNTAVQHIVAPRLTELCKMTLQAYDRLVVPDKLVKTGPYAWCQHPIYTSYMLLFSGFTLLFGSEEWCCLLLYVSWRYYKSRTDTEADMLQETFGNEYKVYQEHIGKFVPKLV